MTELTDAFTHSKTQHEKMETNEYTAYVLWSHEQGVFSALYGFQGFQL